jgi:signal transduction histidine kinase
MAAGERPRLIAAFLAVGALPIVASTVIALVASDAAVAATLVHAALALVLATALAFVAAAFLRARLAAERDRAAREADAKLRALDAANRAKSRFIAAASHDLRQPMHALNLFVAQLRSDHDPAERDRLVARIESAVGNVNELFESLLDISKLDAGVVAPAISDFPLARIFERITATFGPSAADKDLTLAVVATDVWVRSDPTLLERVVSNLVANAVRYTRAGGVVVGVRRQGEGTLAIEVVDTGIGIPADKQARIFSEFYRLQSADTPPGEGLGLGLSIVERLCALLGHRIGLVSLPERGSRFRVTVPRATPPAVPTVAAPGGTPVVPTDPLRGRRVAVIDNDPMVLDSTAGLLRSWGCDVVPADSGASLMTALGDTAPDLVVSDFHLGETEIGSVVVAALRMRFGDDLPALLVSGDITDGARESARAAGLPLLEKPVSAMRLRAMATRLVSSRGVAGAVGG